MNNGVRIKYGNFAPEAKENFLPKTNDSAFDTLEQLQRYNLNVPNYANPCESYQTFLDDSAIAIPSDPENIGFWSQQLSDENGNFKVPIVLELKSDGQYSSQAISIIFDTYKNVYCTNLLISWYRSDALLESEYFNPNSSQFVCEKQVEYYDKIVIVFYRINMPLNRLRIISIDHGYSQWFEPKNIQSVKIFQEINPISSEISINNADFSLRLDDGEKFLFQKKQPFSIYFNGALKSTTFVKSFRQNSKNIWYFQSDDYIGLMDGVQFYGGIYDNKNAYELLFEIFNKAKVPAHIEGTFINETVTGYIPFTTCRDALMQVAFAIQAVVDTSDSDVVNVFKISKEPTQTIPLKRIMQGQNFDDQEKVTGVEILSHTYKPSNITIDVYSAKESGSGEHIFIKFTQPLHSLSISAGSNIVESGTNYAIINADINCSLTGKIYEHTTVSKRKNNPLTLAGDADKIFSINSATLVSKNNVDKVLKMCYDYFEDLKYIKMQIVEGKHSVEKRIRYGEIKYGEKKYGSFYKKTTYDSLLKLGDTIISQTTSKGDVQGVLVKQAFSLNGGIIIKDCTIKR